MWLNTIRSCFLCFSICLLLVAPVFPFDSDELTDTFGLTHEEPENLGGSDHSISYQRNSRGSNVRVSDSPADVYVKIPVEHSFATGESFRVAGYLTGKLKVSAHGSQKLKQLDFERLKLSEEENLMLQKLVSVDGYYRIRVPNRIQHSSEYVFTSIKARCLVAANFSEDLELHMDGNGNIIALNYSPTTPCSKLPLPASVTSWKFKSSTTVKRGAKAKELVPAWEQLEILTASMNEALKPGEVPPKPEEPKTFWQKYWIYIVPLGLIFLNAIASAGQPEAASGTGGSTQRATTSGSRRR